jgi:hypothetical protein
MNIEHDPEIRIDRYKRWSEIRIDTIAIHQNLVLHIASSYATISVFNNSSASNFAALCFQCSIYKHCDLRL